MRRTITRCLWGVTVLALMATLALSGASIGTTIAETLAPTDDPSPGASFGPRPAPRPILAVPGISWR